MSAVARCIPFHGEWSGKKRVDAYFRKLRRMYWRTPIERVEFKERLHDPFVPHHHKRSKALLLGMYVWNEKTLFLNPMGRDRNGWHDVGKVFLHELLHRLNRKTREQTITKREEWLWSSFTGDQRSYLYVCLFAKLKQPLRGIRMKATIPRSRRVQSRLLFFLPWSILYSMKLKLGEVVPVFTLPDQNGKTHNLSDYKGKWVLLYFYPKDDTPGCTKEACGVRDVFPKFKKMGAMVFGVSADSVQKHKKFAEKYKLPFTLLSDESKDVIRKYGVWAKKKFMGREYMGILRTSFLIDPKGKIAKIYEQVKPDVHAQEVLEDLRAFKNL